MIFVFFGTWGCGKSYAAKMIEKNCGIPHLEADILFDEKMRMALQNGLFHRHDLQDFCRRVEQEIHSYHRRSPNVIVSQALYREKYRRYLYNAFPGEIEFVWVQTPDELLQKNRLNMRASQGNPINEYVYDYMKKHWEEPEIPHKILLNDTLLENKLPEFMQAYGLCYEWGEF